MLKRFYSKKSGFTLVEIVVAFAVFSIMASMVCQILDLAVKMRNSNNLYAKELARQEQLLTVIEKDSKNYNEADATGIYALNFDDGTIVNLGYQVKATDPDAENQAEGINYFLSPIDYTCGPSPDAGGLEDSDMGGMTQASRMDTRITGTRGIGDISIYQVYKDEFEYPDDSPFKLAPGHTRYWIEIAASSRDKDLNVTLRQEDVPYAQYRLMFYSDELDAAKSAVEYTDEEGRTYTKDVYKEATIVGVGHINMPFDTIENSYGGYLHESFVTDGGTKNSWNTYVVQKGSSNSVRIGTSFGWNGKDRLEGGTFTRFYVEFDGDPHLTVESFGHNCVPGSYGATVYRACPQYEDTYNDDGTPTYDDNGEVHPCIYGAYMYTRHYKGE